MIKSLLLLYMMIQKFLHYLYGNTNNVKRAYLICLMKQYVPCIRQICNKNSQLKSGTLNAMSVSELSLNSVW